MSIVIDINTFAMVFDSENRNHDEFAPVKSWIEDREGFLLYGGTKYKEELFQSYRTVRLVRQLRDAGSAVEICSKTVDAIEVGVRKAVEGKGCNDPHVIALLAAAHCTLLCSRDKESFPFMKCKAYFPKGSPKVRIYSGKRNIKLLQRCNRADIRNAVA